MKNMKYFTLFIVTDQQDQILLVTRLESKALIRQQYQAGTKLFSEVGNQARELKFKRGGTYPKR